MGTELYLFGVLSRKEKVLVDYSVQTWISALTGSAAVGLIGI
jgi:hypothetical protein